MSFSSLSDMLWIFYVEVHRGKCKVQVCFHGGLAGFGLAWQAVGRELFWNDVRINL